MCSRRVPRTHPPLSARHLPDITLITPVFSRPDSPAESPEIIFFTASRGHHADVGGILPGSMPPTSVNIFEEGAEVVSFKIVSHGRFDRDGLRELMVDRPARYEGGSGCRNFKDVESDLKAVSRNRRMRPYTESPSLTKANRGESQRHPASACP